MVLTTATQSHWELSKIPRNLQQYSLLDLARRLSALRNFIDELRDSGRSLYLGPKSCLGGLVDGLSKNEGVVRWKLRVAKNSTGAAQQKLFADVRKSLDELEMIVELVLHQPLQCNSTDGAVWHSCCT